MRARPASSRRGRLAAVAALGLLVPLGLAGCQDTQSGDEPPAETTSPAAEEGPAPAGSGKGQPAGSDGGQPSPSPDSQRTIDPAVVMDPPGPRKGTLEGPDLLIKSQEAIGEDLIEQIEQTKGVERGVQLTVADVGVNNRVLNVAAVDPGTYRNFAPLYSAELQAQWDRVAGGEMAISDELQTRKLVDKQGWMPLGSDEDAPQAHVGAEAAQVPQVDAVVNELWGEKLGMPMGNAVLVTTGIDSPQVVMTALQKVVGDVAAVSILGPDVSVGSFLTAVPTGGSVAEAIGTFRYTVLGGGRIQPEQSWVSANIRTEDVPILGTVTCHKAMLPQFRAALTEIQTSGLAGKIHPDEYAGCYYPRFIAGSTQLSNHSYGTAIDLNVPGNLRGSVGEIDRTVVAIFKRWGFAWGGDWSYTDPMHFEMNRIVTTG